MISYSLKGHCFAPIRPENSQIEAPARRWREKSSTLAGRLQAALTQDTYDWYVEYGDDAQTWLGAERRWLPLLLPTVRAVAARRRGS